jgi:transcriptional regulator with PAS, ATPase and Fis domain
MNATHEFLVALIDTLMEHIAVIDRQGKILYVNKSWCRFSQENNYTSPTQWVGKNYLEACEASTASGGGGSR